MKIAVTGAGGFLGQHLLPHLVAIRPDVGVVAFSSKDPSTLYTDDRIQYYQRASATDGVAMAGADVLVHCAFPRAVDGISLARGLSYNRDVFHAAVRADVPAIVNISSQSVYSSSRETAASEDTPVSLESPYATAKFSTELLLEAYSSDTTRFSHLRLASLIGPTFDQRVVNKLVKTALSNGELRILRGRSLFAFMDVRDAAVAVIAAIGAQVWKSAPVLNVGAPAAYTLEEMARVVAAQVKAADGTEVVLYAAGDEARQTSSQMDSARFTQLTHFKPSHELGDSVRDIIQAATTC